MALDMAVLGADGSPELCLPIGMRTHDQLIEEASRLNCALVLRMNDYFEDADFSPVEIEGLIGEATRIAESTTDDALRAWIFKFTELAGSELARKRGIAVIAD